MTMKSGLLVLALIGSTTCLAQDAPKKVSRAEAMSAAVAKAPPEYPAVARQLKIEGSVELEALVTEAGVVESVRIVSGNPVLTKPASEAVKKWKFAPFTMDGKAVRALAPVSIAFKL